VVEVSPITTVWIKEHEKETWRKFVELAKREGRSASDLIMNYVRDYVERHSKNPAVPLDTWVTNPHYTLFPTLGEPPDWRKLTEWPRSKLAELRDNAKAYYELSDQLMKWSNIHELEHKPSGIRDKYCPYCRGDG
jgi:hypothetical protein